MWPVRWLEGGNNLSPFWERMVFRNFVLSLPSDWMGQDWIKYWSSRSGEDFKKSSMYFSLCPYIISHWKKAWPFIWTNTNALYLKILCAELSKLTLWLWRKKILSRQLCIFCMLLLPPLGKGEGPSFEYTWTQYIQECFQWLFYARSRVFHSRGDVTIANEGPISREGSISLKIYVS